VKTFARIRKAQRTELLENIIQTTEDDFLAALQVFKLRSIKPKKQSERQREKIVAAIQTHFADKPFTNRDLEEKTLIYCSTVGHYLKMLKEEGKLKRVRKIGGRLAYKRIA
jgi:predicted HTH transcriptional regulator